MMAKAASNHSSKMSQVVGEINHRNGQASECKQEWKELTVVEHCVLQNSQFYSNYLGTTMPLCHVVNMRTVLPGREWGEVLEKCVLGGFREEIRNGGDRKKVAGSTQREQQEQRLRDTGPFCCGTSDVTWCAHLEECRITSLVSGIIINPYLVREGEGRERSVLMLAHSWPELESPCLFPAGLAPVFLPLVCSQDAPWEEVLGGWHSCPEPAGLGGHKPLSPPTHPHHHSLVTLAAGRPGVGGQDYHAPPLARL